MRTLVKVEMSFRGWDLYSFFVATEADWDRIYRWCDSRRAVYLGEIGGKHSDVELVFNIGDFEFVSTDQEFIARFEQVVGPCFGVNILDAMRPRCCECGEAYDDPENDDRLCPRCLNRSAE